MSMRESNWFSLLDIKRDESMLIRVI